MIELLKKLIATPSISGFEHDVATIVGADMEQHGYIPERIGLNLLCYGRFYDPSKPTLLLNSHMDTVKPVSGWMRDPFTPVIEDGCLYGLGSNDAGAALSRFFIHSISLTASRSHIIRFFLPPSRKR